MCAKFEQSYLSQPQRAVIVYMCNECVDVAVGYQKEIKKGSRHCLVLPLCRSCVFANRRCSQTLYFNTILKNKHDKGDEEDVEDTPEGDSGNEDDHGGDSGSDGDEDDSKKSNDDEMTSD